MGNQWGTINYGHVSRLERGEVRENQSRTTSFSRRVSDSTANGEDIDHDAETMSELGDLPHPNHPTLMHRKTMSEQQATVIRRRLPASADYPPYYPSFLKPHDTQMRMLFPNVPNDNRVVLVFRASWNPDDRQDIPGRVFVTLNELYFYSHHYGFTLVSGVSLSRITDVSISRQKEHDLLYLQLEGRDEKDDASLVTVKTFLEPIKTLQRRLKFLTTNCSAEEPQSLEDTLRILIDLEMQGNDQADSGSDSESSETRFTTLQRRRAGTLQSGYGLKVDRSLFGTEQMPVMGHEASDILRFRLPTQPVLYAPKDMTEVAAESTFGVSAKALFHIMFGDKSAIAQTMYSGRRGTSVKQYPWTSTSDSRLTRKFEYEISPRDGSTEAENTIMVDSQTVEIANDHLCYVVTDLKTPWHLPYARDFTLVAKYVITHIAKSKCLLRIFTAVEWRRAPALSKALIERQAMDDLRVDAQDLLNLIVDQVQKLGPNCYTKKAIEIFGHLGQQNEAATITANDTSVSVRTSRLTVRRRTMYTLVLENVRSLLYSAASTVVMSILACVSAFRKVVTAHSLLTALLVVSVLFNLQWTTETAATWWQDRSASRIAQQLGIGPNVVLSRSIHLQELNRITSAEKALPNSYTAGNDDQRYNGSRNSTSSNNSSSNKCVAAFQSVVLEPSAHPSSFSSSPDTSSHPFFSTLAQPHFPSTASPTLFQTISPYSTSPSSSSRTSQRIRRTRQKLGIYRHDLMVALRVVNALEKETIQAEYEEWLFHEGSNCEKIGSLLQAAATIESLAPSPSPSPSRNDTSSPHSDTGTAPTSEGIESDHTNLRGDDEHLMKNNKVFAERDLDGLEEWFSEYCGDCFREREAMIKRDESLRL